MTRTMRRYLPMTAGLALLLTLGACRQPDGPVPTPQGEQTNRIEDISRDLENLAAKDANAAGELYDDLTYLEAVPRPEARLKDLAQALAVALGGTSLSGQDADTIANHLFIAVSGRELSATQVEKVGDDVREALVSVGASAESADRAAAATSALAGDVTENKKRWYQR